MNKSKLGIVLTATGFALFSMGAFAGADHSTTSSVPTQPPSDRNVTPGDGNVTTGDDMSTKERLDRGPRTDADRNANANGDGEGLTDEDRDFLENAAQSGLAEVEGSQLALDSDASPAVREFAQKMIEDHTKANAELRKLAESKNFTLPEDPSVAQRAELVALRALSGQPFDRMYAARIGEAAHENAVQLFEQASQEVSDSDIRAYIDKTLPKLREHLEMARELRAQVGND